MYRLHSSYDITTAQSEAVDDICQKFDRGKKRQVLLGVTGSGKTFSMANIVSRLGMPTLVLSPNKTLAAQLYQEFKGFFPRNNVGYFISYYDYYQPEAFVPQRNLYIAKEVSINKELERLRIDAARKLLESPYTIIVASVSSIYSIGSPEDFRAQKNIYLKNATVDREQVIRDFVGLGYERTEELILRGKFRIRGETVEIFPTSEEQPVRLVLDGEIISEIESFDAISGAASKSLNETSVFPINYFYYKQARIDEAINRIRVELDERLAYFKALGKEEYAQRLKQKTRYDLEMLKQYGHCPGIENYSLYLTRREPGEPPYTLIDFMGKPFLTIIDESHISLPQLRGMYNGDRSRKIKLVNYGFRLPSALDNRPLNFQEFDGKTDHVLYVSATPAAQEIADSSDTVTELLVRPTGLIDPVLETRHAESPVEDMIPELEKTTRSGQRVLITTLTKKMSEKLTDYLLGKGMKCSYMHAEIKPLDRVKIIKKLRSGEIDILVGINLLREGLDLPEVSLVVILDADREGFLRSETSLIQTFGRAARHVSGRVIMYVREISPGLQQAINESERRKKIQLEFNRVHGIEPVSIVKKIKDFHDDDYWIQKSDQDIVENFPDRESLENEIDSLTQKMKELSDQLDFRNAAVLRDRIKGLRNLLIEFY